MRCARRIGFTLVEILVVIAIVGVLMALLLPAVQSARESGRRSSCANNLRQLAIGCLQHEAQQKYFPSGGWSTAWVGDSSLGFGEQQPGSWLFSILPFIGETDLHQLGNDQFGAEKLAAIARQNQIPVPLFSCPTRGLPALRPEEVQGPRGFDPAKADRIRYAVRADYAANMGDEGVHFDDGLPRSFIDGPQDSERVVLPNFDWTPYTRWKTGVIYVRSQVTSGMISDGLSTTLLVGEKKFQLGNGSFELPRFPHGSAFAGCNVDNQRTLYTNCPAVFDQRERTSSQDDGGIFHILYPAHGSAALIRTYG